MDLNKAKYEGYCPKCGNQIPGRWENPPKRDTMFYLL